MTSPQVHGEGWVSCLFLSVVLVFLRGPSSEARASGKETCLPKLLTTWLLLYNDRKMPNWVHPQLMCL